MLKQRIFKFIKKANIITLLMCFFIVMLSAIVINESNAAETYTEDGVTATLSDEGTLTFSGSGTIKEELVREFDYENGIKTIVIEEGITKIGYDAFSDCAKLTNITVPNSVIYIEDNAFSGCSSLTNIEVDTNNSYYSSEEGVLFDKDKSILKKYPMGKIEERYIIPSSVTKIWEDAFYRCSNLESIEIPSSVTSIWSHAFYGCSSLESIEIPNSVTSVGRNAFVGCTVRIYLDSDNQTEIETPNILKRVLDSNDILYSNKALKLLNCAFSENNEKIVIDKDNIKSGVSIEVNDGLLKGVTYYISNKEIDVSSRGNGSVMAKISGRDTVVIIGTGEMEDSSVAIRPFETETSSKIKYIISTDKIKNVIIEEGVTSIGINAFCGCRRLESIGIPSSVTRIYSGAFTRCSSLSNINLNENNNEYFCEENVLFNKDKTILKCYAAGKTEKNYTIPEGVTTINAQAFYGCSNLENIEISSSVTDIGGSAFEKCNSLKSINIPEGVTDIYSGTFEDCSSLESIEIPNSVTSIGDSAFYGCSSLNSIVIPSSVRSIGKLAFEHCSKLTNVTISEGLTSIGDYAFYNCIKLENITIPEGVASIGYRSFSRCSSLENIEIPSSVTSIGERSFYECNKLTTINVKENNNNYSSENGVVFNKEKTKIIFYPAGKFDKSYIIPSSVTNIEYGVFEICSNLENIVIPNGVTSIGDKAFSECINLTSIIIPNSVENIGSYVFDQCGKLTIYCTSNSTAQSYAEENNINYIIDDKKPSISGNENGNDWVKSNVTLTIEDEGCGLKEVTINEKKIEIGEDGKIIYTISENGEWKVIAKDYLGNTEEEMVKIDKTKPTLKVTGNPNNWTTQDVTLTIQAEDSESGVKNVKVNGTEVTLNNNGQGTYKVTQNGTYNIVATDNVGNISDTEIVEVGKIDKTKPTLKVTGNPNNWTTQDVTLTIQAEDSESGVKNVKVNGTEVTLNNNGQGTYKVTQNGTYNIVATDNAGNISNTWTEEVENIRRITGITVEQGPNETEYYSGETLNTEGLKIKVQYDNNTEETITSGFECTPTTLNSEGTQKIKVTYEGKETEISVNVINVIDIQNYSLENNTILNIQPNTTINEFDKNIKVNSKIQYKIMDKTGTEIQSGENITTGSKIQTEVNGETVEYKIVVKGDTTGDGKADIKDILAINKHRLNKAKLKNEYLQAGDINKDGESDIKDILQINKYRLGKITKL